MSKLTTVRDALQANPEVLVLDTQERVYLPRPSGYWTHTIAYFTAPREGLYTVEALQSFMLGLVEIEPSLMDEFRSWHPSRMEFGKLYFDEVIGSSTTILKTEIHDPDVPLPDDYIDGVLTINEGGILSEDLNRRTWVRVYPDADYATRAMAGTDPFSTENFYVPAGVIGRSGIGRRVKAITSKR